MLELPRHLEATISKSFITLVLSRVCPVHSIDQNPTNTPREHNVVLQAAAGEDCCWPARYGSPRLRGETPRGISKTGATGAVSPPPPNSSAPVLVAALSPPGGADSA